MLSTVERYGVVGVLEALEEAAREPNIGLADFSEIFGKEKWGANRNACVHSQF